MMSIYIKSDPQNKKKKQMLFLGELLNFTCELSSRYLQAWFFEIGIYKLGF